MRRAVGDESGWIAPKRDDLIIQDARDVYAIAAIARRAKISAKTCEHIIARAYAHEHLTEDEAALYGIAAARSKTARVAV